MREIIYTSAFKMTVLAAEFPLTGEITVIPTANIHADNLHSGYVDPEHRELRVIQLVDTSGNGIVEIYQRALTAVQTGNELILQGEPNMMRGEFPIEAFSWVPPRTLTFLVYCNPGTL